MTHEDDIAEMQALEAAVDALMSVYARLDGLFVFDVVGPPGAHTRCDPRARQRTV